MMGKIHEFIDDDFLEKNTFNPKCSGQFPHTFDGWNCPVCDKEKKCQTNARNAEPLKAVLINWFRACVGSARRILEQMKLSRW